MQAARGRGERARDRQEESLLRKGEGRRRRSGQKKATPHMIMGGYTGNTPRTQENTQRSTYKTTQQGRGGRGDSVAGYSGPLQAPQPLHGAPAEGQRLHV
jgi:hypothetical protein